MKKLHYFDLEQQKQRKHSTSNHQHIKSALLAKYFPKYQKEFLLTNLNGTIKSKIKRVKIIKNFQTSSALKTRPDWRILLATKMKNVKTLSNLTESRKQFAEKLKYFSGLKSATNIMSLLARSPFRPPNKKEESYQFKAFKNIGYVRNLESLEIHPVSIGTKKFLPRLNSHKKLLSSLKTLKFFFDWKDASDSELSELIENNKNLLKNVTSLS